jgi:hypothetical protein
MTASSMPTGRRQAQPERDGGHLSLSHPGPRRGGGQSMDRLSKESPDLGVDGPERIALGALGERQLVILNRLQIREKLRLKRRPR